jgi:hypothetical protein
MPTNTKRRRTKKRTAKTKTAKRKTAKRPKKKTVKRPRRTTVQRSRRTTVQRPRRTTVQRPRRTTVQRRPAERYDEEEEYFDEYDPDGYDDDDYEERDYPEQRGRRERMSTQESRWRVNQDVREDDGWREREMKVRNASRTNPYRTDRIGQLSRYANVALPAARAAGQGVKAVLQARRGWQKPLGLDLSTVANLSKFGIPAATSALNASKALDRARYV